MGMHDLFGVVDDPVTEAARMLAQHYNRTLTKENNVVIGSANTQEKRNEQENTRSASDNNAL